MSLNDQCGLFGQKETKNKQQNKQTNKQKLFILTPLCYAVEILLFIGRLKFHICVILTYLGCIRIMFSHTESGN